MAGAVTSPDPRGLRGDLVAAAVAAVVTMAAVVWSCGGADILTGRPVKFAGDAVFHAVLAKAALDDPWTWHAHRLGAPYGASLAAFGVVLPVETAIMKIVGLTTADPVALLNRTWVVLTGLGAASAYAALRLLGLGRAAAFVGGCLFATAPTTFLRNVTHFNLHTAFVPFPTALATLVASGRVQALSRRSFLAVAAGTAVAGLGYVYWPFIHAITLGAALGIAWLVGQRTAIPRGLVALAIVAAAGTANLAPTLASWARDGRPATLDYKSPGEADVFGLRIRDLVMPSSHSIVPPLAALGRGIERIDWPLPGESRLAKLGLVATAGFLLTIAVLLGWSPAVAPPLRPVVRGAASLVLVLLLVAVPGGFGSIFNALVTPQFRCYNRVVAPLAFLSLVAVVACVERLVERRRPWAAACAWGGLLVAGLVDQNVAFATRARAGDAAAERARVAAFVATVEAALPDGAAVCMLPDTPFPLDTGRGSMAPFDHAKPSLFSRHARWSWPVFGPRHERLRASLGDPASAGFAARVRGAGYGFVWLDRAAPADEVSAIEAAVTSAGATLVHEDPSGRYRVFDLARVEAAAVGDSP
jgi:phosphoglycerol transferase